MARRHLGGRDPRREAWRGDASFAMAPREFKLSIASREFKSSTASREFKLSIASLPYLFMVLRGVKPGAAAGGAPARI